MRGRFLVGYFASVDAIHYQGRPIELADLQIEGGELTGQDPLCHADERFLDP
jgi:hypothetical protein